MPLSQNANEVRAILGSCKNALVAARDSLQNNQIPGLQSNQAYNARDEILAIIAEMNAGIEKVQLISDTYEEINNMA